MVLFYPLRWVGQGAACACAGFREENIGRSQRRPANPVKYARDYFQPGCVFVSVQAAGLPSTDFTVSEPGSASQVATAVAFKPFGSYPSHHPVRTALRRRGCRSQAAGEKTHTSRCCEHPAPTGREIVQDGPTTALFGRQITGLQTLVDLYVDGTVPKR